MKRTCATPDCDNTARAQGLCGRCYGALYRAGRITLADRSNQHRITVTDLESQRGECSICGPVDIRVRKDGRGAECMVRRRQRREGKHYPAKPRTRRRGKYGLTDQELQALESQAAGRCLICDDEFGGDGYQIDHCHETGVVRGLLCRRCNLALGWLNDEPRRVLSAYFYLVSGGKSASA